MSSLEQSIVATLSYFDIFDYPLTAFEIYTLLYNPQHERVAYETLLLLLSESAELGAVIENRDGFYFLIGREGLIDIRQSRYRSNVKKIKKIKKLLSLLLFIPYIRMIALCNNLAFLNARKKSDLDIFITTTSGALPFVRILTILVSVLFFKRPSVSHHEDTICLSFFIDRSDQDISRFAIDDDIYLRYWTATLQPVYVYDEYSYQSFLDDNALLMRPFTHHVSKQSTLYTQSRYSFYVKRFLEVLCMPFIRDPLRTFLFSWQSKRLPLTIRKTMNTSSSVAVTKGVFKSHLSDKRYDIRRIWQKKLDRYAV